MSRITLLGLLTLIVFLGVGVYGMVPGAAYGVVLAAIAIAIGNKEFRRSVSAWIPTRMFVGALLLAGFLATQIFFGRLEFRDFFYQISATVLMLLTYSFVSMSLFDDRADDGTRARLVAAIFSIGIAGLLIAQFGQILGFVERFDVAKDMDQENFISSARPGGFLNPNTTAAIAVTLLFGIERLDRRSEGYWFVSLLPVTMLVVGLSQSRSVLLVLAVLFGYSLFGRSVVKIGLMFLPVVGAALLLLVSFPELTQAVFENFMDRFEGDDSSDERTLMLNRAWEAFQADPWFGMGPYFLIERFGVSSHNQLLEILAVYGLTGFVMFAAAFVLIFLPFSWVLGFVCIAPTFVFSHNFFDSISFQAVLGAALAIDRLSQSDRP